MVILKIMVFVLGVCCGSFVNMLVYRTAEKYKIPNHKKKFPINFQIVKNKSQNRSFCDFCGKQLRWYENIPVLSWVVQNGKSRCCDMRLPMDYPIVELGMGVLFLVYGMRFLIYELNIVLWTIGLVVITMLVFEMVFDTKYMILPDFSTVILIVAGVLRLLFESDNPLPYVYGAVGGWAFLLLLHIITKGKGMGMGDVKLVFFMGLWLGWQRLALAMYIAFISGAIAGLGVVVLGKRSTKTKIAFGPFLIAGTFIAWWWGESIIKYLIQNF